jgi:hypothetical protein
MPEISRFYGLVIYMYAADHAPPHFHVKVGGRDVLVYIASGDVDGELSAAEHKRVRAWLRLHRPELEQNWSRCEALEAPLPVEPLK